MDVNGSTKDSMIGTHCCAPAGYRVLARSNSRFSPSNCIYKAAVATWRFAVLIFIFFLGGLYVDWQIRVHLFPGGDFMWVVFHVVQMHLFHGRVIPTFSIAFFTSRGGVCEYPLCLCSVCLLTVRRLFARRLHRCSVSVVLFVSLNWAYSNVYMISLSMSIEKVNILGHCFQIDLLLLLRTGPLLCEYGSIIQMWKTWRLHCQSKA